MKQITLDKQQKINPPTKQIVALSLDAELVLKLDAATDNRSWLVNSILTEYFSKTESEKVKA